ncbi:hypothetical protein KM043_004365 [Ampulex compressa]|nr:hypothetical protein KM043_004365 [Ampulex compressa]
MEHALASTTRRRGHQHHPRHATRRRLDASSRGPAQCGPAGTVKDATVENVLRTTSSSPRLAEKSAVIEAEGPAVTRHAAEATALPTVGARWARNPLELTKEPEPLLLEDKEELEFDVRQRLAQCSLDVEQERHEDAPGESKAVEAPRSRPRGKGEAVESRAKDEDSPEPEHAVARARGDGNSDDESTNVEEDPELAELAKLRCPSERAEVQAEREARRRKRCADYPGLAFGCSIFSSDTMMKFSLIRNELQNISGNQLKRVSIAR